MSMKLHRGGLARTVKGAEARRTMRRLAHSTVIEVQGTRTIKEVASAVAWWKDLRRDQQTIYGSLLRFIDVSVSLGTPVETLKKIPRWLDRYIDDLVA